MSAQLVDFFTWVVFCYFVFLNMGYLTLNLCSLVVLRRHVHEEILADLPQLHTALEVPTTIIVPAYNEESTIAGSVRSMLQLAYREYEIVVVNDGSRDGTLEALREAFALEPFPEALRVRISTQPVRQVYLSARHPNLRVIDKENGGKADALNAGINIARYPLFCSVDADSVLQRDSLRRVTRPFQRDDSVVATGGMVRVANGCEVSDGFLTRVGLPRNALALFQVVEYLRAFLFGRLGWSALGGMLIISGAFGVFRKATVISAGGYRTQTIGEDMELVVRLHRVLRARGERYRIEFAPDPVCWTEAPEDLRTLRNQRVRWHRGLSESLAAHWPLMFSRRGGAPGWIAFPFLLLFEWLGPVIEVSGYVFLAVAVFYGWIDWTAFAAFLFLTVGLGILLSISGLLLEEMCFHIYPKPRHLCVLGFVAVAENFGYGQINSWWRLIGILQWAFQRKAVWGAMKRKAAWQRNA